jgi:hypothetical protein
MDLKICLILKSCNQVTVFLYLGCCELLKVQYFPFMFTNCQIITKEKVSDIIYPTFYIHL